MKTIHVKEPGGPDSMQLADVPTPSLCRAARAAGIDHVSGDALMPALPLPGRAFVVTRGA